VTAVICDVLEAASVEMTDLEDSMAIQQYRYLTALPQADQQIFLAWRLLASDLPQTAFQIAYRQGDGDRWQPATTQPIADSTNALIKLSQPTTYQFRVVAGGNLASEIATVDAGAEAVRLGQFSTSTNRGHRVPFYVI
jgi:hypothetical protein